MHLVASICLCVTVVVCLYALWPLGHLQMDGQTEGQACYLPGSRSIKGRSRKNECPQCNATFVALTQ